MTIFKNFSLALSILLVGVFTTGYVALSATYNNENQGYARDHTLLNAVTTSSTSTTRQIAGAKSAVFEFASDGPNGSGNGTTTFKAQVSIDGTTFHDYNKLISNVTNTNAQDLTRVGSVEITATSSALYTMDLSGESFALTRCVSVEAGTTTASCKVFIQN